MYTWYSSIGRSRYTGTCTCTSYSITYTGTCTGICTHVHHVGAPTVHVRIPVYMYTSRTCTYIMYWVVHVHTTLSTCWCVTHSASEGGGGRSCLVLPSLGVIAGSGLGQVLLFDDCHRRSDAPWLCRAGAAFTVH